MDVTQIDKNFVISERFSKEDLAFYDAESQPFRIYGVFREGDRFCRMPEKVAKSVNPGVGELYEHAAGGRVRFVTNSRKIAISAQMTHIFKIGYFALTGSAGFDLYENDSRYRKTYVPDWDITDTKEGLYEAKEEVTGDRIITINFPTYSAVKKLHIGLEKGATLLPAPEYKISAPVVYYGSSITQGACASRPGAVYSSIIERHLNCDYINLGFSGNAHGEPVMAEYIAGLSMSAFVMDYDYNAETPEELESTHEAFYKIIRGAQKDLPIIMLSVPNYYDRPDLIRRRQIIERTYRNAIAAGDRNLYYLPGNTLFDADAADTALIDGTHPNDAGFLMMARKLEPLLAKVLK